MVAFKERFYPCKWTRYELARPGSLGLLPAGQARIVELERDYRAMQMMLFGQPPEFSSIIEALTELEQAINSLSARLPTQT